MKLRLALFSVLAPLCITLSALVPAVAQQTLYENGPINGNTDAWTINRGFFISDNFTLSTGNSTVSGMSFGVWLTPGDTLQSVEVTLSSQPLQIGTIYFDGIVNLTQSGCVMNSYSYEVCTETGSFTPSLLPSGVSWVTLQNGVTSLGDPVYWDENSGVGCHSPGCPSQALNDSLPGGTLPSEAFTILGDSTSTTGTAPEPGSLMLFGSGVLGLAAAVRRKLM